jgi:hypothetical protein
MNQIEFDGLENADLIVDCTYKGGKIGNSSDDPIHLLVQTEIQGGFRRKGSITKEPIKLESICLVSNLRDNDWPDLLDVFNGYFVYYGDNKKPGKELHDTGKKGNLVLKYMFDSLHLGEREKIPPIFIFTNTGEGRDVVFRGLAVPGLDSIKDTDDLVAIWKTKSNQRFQNYKATFSILDVQQISRAWINDITLGNPDSKNAPDVWKTWRETGNVKRLCVQNSIKFRSKEEQLPFNSNDNSMLSTIIEYFDHYEFEQFAADIFSLLDKNVENIEMTRFWRDGGRDAIGKYRIGLSVDPVEVEFALEAKHYKTNNSIGVREISRLISRIKNRQFGVLVTTSYVGKQALCEIKEDGHPILCITGGDIISILKKIGIINKDELEKWLDINYNNFSHA